jgi:hypothetical protein
MAPVTWVCARAAGVKSKTRQSAVNKPNKIVLIFDMVPPFELLGSQCGSLSSEN